MVDLSRASSPPIGLTSLLFLPFFSHFPFGEGEKTRIGVVTSGIIERNTGETAAINPISWSSLLSKYTANRCPAR